MANGNAEVTLYGRVFLRGAVEVVTGLHIGGAAGPLAIGGVDNPVIRNVLTGQPYIPGSSLKGKMRSLTERAIGAELNWTIQRRPRVALHICQTAASYATCRVCPVFGCMGQMEFSQPTRLVARDVYLEAESVARLEQARTDLPFTEVKWEAAIDRVTSAATPRQVERVPAGAVFKSFELVYSLYEPRDWDGFRTLARAMQLLEDDYLGGMGSRGGGKVRFTELELLAKARAGYERAEAQREKRVFGSLQELLAGLDEVLTWLQRQVPLG